MEQTSYYQVKGINIFAFVFIILPFFKPDIVVSFPKINYIFYVYLATSLIIIITIYVKKNVLSKFLLIYMIYFLITFFSTIINNGNVIKMIVDFMQNIGIIMIVEIFSKNNIKKLLKVFSYLFYFLMIANTLSFVLLPSGIVKTEIMMEPIYLLGIDNRFAFIYIPGICIISIYDLLIKKRITKFTYMYILITYITFIYFWSAGALVAETLIIIFFVFLDKKINFNPLIYLRVNLIAFIMLVFFRVQDFFKVLIVDILHKDLTLSSRTLLWDKAIIIIKENLFIGIGIQKTKTMLSSISAYHAHCYFLNIMLQSGIFGLVIFIYEIYLALKKLSIYKKKLISKILSFTIFTMLVMLLVDTFDITCNFMMILSLGYSIGEIIKEGEIYE